MLSSALLSPAPATAVSVPGRGHAVRAGAGRGFPAGLVADAPAAGVAAKTDGSDDDATGQGIADDGKDVPDLTATDPLAWLATMTLPPVPVAPPGPATPTPTSTLAPTVTPKAVAGPATIAAAAAPAAVSAASAAPLAGVALAATPGLPTATPLATPAEPAAGAAAADPDPVRSSPAPSGLAAAPPAALPTDLGAPVAPGQPAPIAGLPFAADPALASAAGPIVIQPGSRTAPPAAPVTEATAATPLAAAMAQAQAPAPPVQAGTTAPASQVFAAAIHAATRDDERKAAPADRDAPATPALAATATATATVDPGSHAVAATGDTSGQASLDLRQERWPHAMVDHIERLRDDANAADTRIRLQPDALGSIDVSVRRDGDTLHVRFDADQAATRTLLADAQPRLADIAEARGLKLGQADIGGGSAQGWSGSGQGRPSVPAAPPAAPTAAAAASTVATGDAASTDTRIA